MWTPPERIRHQQPAANWPSAEQAAASRLFSPIRIGPLELEQRTWVPAMVPWRATPDGLVNDDVIDWYCRFAAGRPGAIVVEATGIRDVASGPLLRIGHDRFVPGLRRLVDAVREASGGHTRLLIQIIDFLTIRRRVPATTYFGRFFSVRAEHRQRLAALTNDVHWDSATDEAIRDHLAAADDEVHEHVLTRRELDDLRFGYRERVTDTHLEHIADLPRYLPPLFADAAQRAQHAGFDGVELHYAHAYTMASFLSRLNMRDDGYGGDLTGRLRVPLDVYAAVRARVGADFCVGCRMLADEVVAGGSPLEDATKIALAFARAGMDFLSLSKGGKFEDAAQPAVGQAAYPYTGQSGYECMPTVYSDPRGPFARNVGLAAHITHQLRASGCSTPVVAAGGICTFDIAEGLLARGDADIVAAARQSLADPDWFLKMRLGYGHAVRRCKYTNYCEALDTRHKQVTCQLWDRVELDTPDIPLSHDGRRRLVAPRWPDRPTLDADKPHERGDSWKPTDR